MSYILSNKIQNHISGYGAKMMGYNVYWANLDLEMVRWISLFLMIHKRNDTCILWASHGISFLTLFITSGLTKISYPKYYENDIHTYFEKLIMSRKKVLSAIIKKYDQLSMPENCVSQKGSLEGCLILILVYCFFCKIAWGIDCTYSLSDNYCLHLPFFLDFS